MHGPCQNTAGTATANSCWCSLPTFPWLCWGPHSASQVQALGEAKPSRLRQGLQTGGGLEAKLTPEWRAGSGRASAVGCGPGARSPGGTEHWPAWLPSAAHSMRPQTRRPGWRSAVDRKEACCRHGPRDGVGRGGYRRDLPQATHAHREALGPSLEMPRLKEEDNVYLRAPGRAHTHQDGGEPSPLGAWADGCYPGWLLSTTCSWGGGLCTPSPPTSTPISSSSDVGDPISSDGRGATDSRAPPDGPQRKACSQG